MQFTCGEALPAIRIGPLARKKRGLQDDRVEARNVYFFGVGSSAGLM
jgi:hypothetical protein